MSESEKRCFYFAALINTVAFVVLNIYSSVSEKAKYEASEIKFAHDGYSWGFPFSMYSNYLGFPHNDIGFTPGLIFNLFALAATIAITGIAFITIASQIRSLRKGENDS